MGSPHHLPTAELPVSGEALGPAYTALAELRVSPAGSQSHTHTLLFSGRKSTDAGQAAYVKVWARLAPVFLVGAE